MDIALRHRKVRRDGLHSLDEEGAGAILQQGFPCGQLRQVGQGQRGDGQFVFPREP